MTKISRIIDCDATTCLYNRDNRCHTFAINVGDELPICDTFTSTSARGGWDDVEGGIGSCKVQKCSHNKSFECTCDGVHMHVVGNHVDCTSYRKK